MPPKNPKNVLSSRMRDALQALKDQARAAGQGAAGAKALADARRRLDRYRSETNRILTALAAAANVDRRITVASVTQAQLAALLSRPAAGRAA